MHKAADGHLSSTGPGPSRWHRVVPARLAERRWLTGEGSLTQRLREASATFGVLRLAQHRGGACHDELPCIRPAARSGAAGGAKVGAAAGRPRATARPRTVLSREVLLLCDGLPTVWAHSVIDAAALRGRWRWLAGLGNRPLGEALFRDPQVQRGPLSFRRLRAPDPRYLGAAAELSARGLSVPRALWARRSVFVAGGRQLLVTEVFLPAVASLRPVRAVRPAILRPQLRAPAADDLPDGR